MVKMINGKNEVKYAIETIKEIVHGKYKEFYSREDILGNEVKPNDSVLIIRFKDGTTASFGNRWQMIFE